MHNITKPIFKNRIIIYKIYIFYSYVIDRILFLFYIIKFNSINSILETFKKESKCVPYLYTYEFNKMAIPKIHNAPTTTKLTTAK